MAATLIAILALGACTPKDKRVSFDGKFYPARDKPASRDDRKQFVITVRRVSQGLDGARAAGHHAGTGYCVKNYGTSKIEWVRGPEDPAETIVTSNGTLSLTGRCVTW